MMIGCCHCGEEVSESTPSESVPSESVLSESFLSESESVGLSVEAIDCGDCDAVPVTWKVTLADWTNVASLPSHGACCQSRNRVFFLRVRTGPYNTIIINNISGTSYCRIWESDERAKIHASTPPSCADGTLPWVAMGIRFAVGVTSMSLTVYQPAGFTTETHNFYESGAAVCFKDGLLPFGSMSLGSVCQQGTVYVEPAT